MWDVARRPDTCAAVDRNVARLVRPPRGPIRHGRSLTLDAARQLLAAAVGHRFEAVYVLMLVLGLRPGEALGLRWSDVDLDRGTLTVTQALKRGRHGLRVGPLKTRQSRRRVGLPAPALTALQRRLNDHASERAGAANEWVDHDLVFTTRTGGPVDPPAVARHLVPCQATFAALTPAR